MNARHKAREAALQILYGYEGSKKAIPTAGHAMAEDLRKHFDHFQVAPAVREFAAELVAGTLQKMPEIDGFIEKAGAQWKIARMALVDRSLLRMAVYELMHFSETAPSIIMDEAIELAKQFGTGETPAFVNGILDAIAKLPEIKSRKN